jgi:hypothetical protein
MKLIILGGTSLCFFIAIYFFLIDSDVKAPVFNGESKIGTSSVISNETTPFKSNSIATGKSALKPVESSVKRDLSDLEIAKLEEDLSDSIAAYNQSIADGQPDAEAIAKIAALKEKYKQQALKGVRENNN